MARLDARIKALEKVFIPTKNLLPDIRVCFGSGDGVTVSELEYVDGKWVEAVLSQRTISCCRSHYICEVYSS